MAEKKKQQMRYSDAELSLIKNTFADNDDLVRAIRKLFLQMPIDAIDRQVLKGYKNRDVINLLKKTFVPTLDPNAPPHQLLDLWMTVTLKDRTPEQVFPEILAREMLIDFLEQQLESFEFESQEKTRLDDFLKIEGKTPLEVYIGLYTRNTVIAHVEMMLTQLVNLAGIKTETVEETKKRLLKDSTK
jgi:hypothetical protein